MLERFYETCKKNNLKITPQRIEIYKQVIKSKDHPPLIKIYKKVKKKFPNISIDTVYRTLKKFTQLGIIKEVENYEDFKRYDGFIEKHNHFHCIKCYKIIDVPKNFIEKINLFKLPFKEFLILDYKVLIQGFCKECQKNIIGGKYEK